jgi:hypothetical protein
MTGDASFEVQFGWFRRALRRLLLEGDAEALSQMSFTANLLVPLHSPFPPRLFDFLLTTTFSWRLSVFDRRWRCLSPDQRALLLEAIRVHYSSFHDWMAYFAISELLGECYANRAALNVLNELRHTVNVRARALVPHAYEHIVTDADNDRVARNALEMLFDMAGDPHDDVRDEVAVSLARIRRRGGHWTLRDRPGVVVDGRFRRHVPPAAPSRMDALDMSDLPWPYPR